MTLLSDPTTPTHSPAATGVHRNSVLRRIRERGLKTTDASGLIDRMRREAGELRGCTLTNFYEIANGSRRLDVVEAKELAKLLGWSTDELVAAITEAREHAKRAETNA